MNCLDKPLASLPLAQDASDATVVLVREAGVPDALALNPTGNQDPLVEWLSLMEVVQMLCPIWPVRDQPLRGEHWRI